MTTLIQVVPEAKRKNILLSHAMSGSDTTSSIFGIGKTKLLKNPILEQSPNDAFLLTDNDCAIKDITDAGEWIILKLYGNHKSKTLDELRVLTYRKKLLSKSAKNKIDPRSLPPSSNAAKYYTLRVYHTLQEWGEHSLDPKMYGFFDFDAKLEAPENLLKTIISNCSKSACQSGKRSCKNFPLYCNELCGCSDNCANICPINDEIDVDTQEDSN